VVDEPAPPTSRASGVLRCALRAAAIAVGVALLARGLMRLVALDTLGRGTFSVVGTVGIGVLFVLSAAGAAVGRALTARRPVLVAVVVGTSGLLWESDVAIGLSSLEDARARPMTPLRWVGFWLLFAVISALAALTSWVGLRTGRTRGPVPRPRERRVAAPGQPVPCEAGAGADGSGTGAAGASAAPDRLSCTTAAESRTRQATSPTTAAALERRCSS
jgi:hypothetical protein